MTVHRWTLTAALLLASTPAFAASFKKMTLDQIVNVLLHDKSDKNREKAADWIKDQRLVDATPSLREACNATQPQFPCEHALWALESFHTPEAHAAIESVLLDKTLEPYRRKVAMRVLGREDRGRLGVAALQVLTNYRQLDDEFSVPLIKAMVDGGATQGGDLAILIATDLAAKRKTRLEALDAAAAFHHPRLFEAELALIDDSDVKVRLRVIEDLGRSGLFGTRIQPALIKAAGTDSEGNVRAAAFKALRNYANADVLPLLHKALISEPNIAAWGHALAMFSALADQSSVPTLSELLRRGNLIDDTAIRLIQLSVRLNDPAVVPALQTLHDGTKSDTVRVEAERALAWFQGPPATRVAYVVPPPEVVVWNPLAIPEPVLPAMSVQLAADGSVISLSGGMLGVSGSVSVSGVPTVTASVDATVPAGGSVADYAVIGISGPDFEELLRAMNDASFSSDKLGVLQSAASSWWFTADQVGRVFEVLSYSEDRLTAAQMLAPRTLDRENAWKVLGTLTFSSEKEEIRKLFQ